MCCGNCGNNDDGLCDYLGCIVVDDDNPEDFCGAEGWVKRDD